MRVSLVGMMQFAPDYFYHEVEGHGFECSEPELLASACMRYTRQNKPLRDIIEDSDNETIKKRIRESIEWKHFTVAGMTDFVFEIRGVSRALTHQLVRHRTAWYLQQSQRSVDPTEGDDWYVIPPDIEKDVWKRCTFKIWMKLFKDIYHTLISMGTDLEDARFVLPNATKTNIIMKIDGSNLLHFFKLRLDPTAQWEIRELAQKMHDLVVEECPNLFDKELSEYWW